MIKTIKFDKDHPVELNASMGWLFVYRNQFGHDILPELMPMLEAVLSLAQAVLSAGDITNPKDIVKNIDETDISNALLTLSGMEMTTIIDIVWAMAKNADRDIPEPVEWVNQFDRFPLDDIVPAVLKMVLESSVTTKNSRRLLGILTKRKSTSTK